MNALTPVYTADLLEPLHALLMSLLRGLASGDWERPTAAGAWKVRDVAAHLLDGDLRKLSFARDGHAMTLVQPIRGYGDLVAFLNQMNAGGVAHAQRFSPRVLTDLLEVTGHWITAYMRALPPHETAVHAVAWAGEDRSENWMDIGREYTERWHHQMHIRDAVGAPGLLDARWMSPLLDLSARALPRAYADLRAADGTAVVITIAGEGGGVWSLIRDREAWRLWRGRAVEPAAEASLDASDAWRLFFHALSGDEIRRRVTTRGDAALIAPLAATRAVMV
jgi:hypothetical protein